MGAEVARLLLGCGGLGEGRGVCGVRTRCISRRALWVTGGMLGFAEGSLVLGSLGHLSGTLGAGSRRGWFCEGGRASEGGGERKVREGGDGLVLGQEIRWAVRGVGGGRMAGRGSLGGSGTSSWFQRGWRGERRGEEGGGMGREGEGGGGGKGREERGKGGGEEGRGGGGEGGGGEGGREGGGGGGRGGSREDCRPLSCGEILTEVSLCGKGEVEPPAFHTLAALPPFAPLAARARDKDCPRSSVP